jgi:hypothetical protein
MACLQENPAVRLVCRLRRGHSPSVRFHSVLCLLDFRPAIIFWNFLQAPLPRYPYAHHTHRLVRVGPSEKSHVSPGHFTGLGSPLPVVSPLPSCWREVRRPYRWIGRPCAPLPAASRAPPPAVCPPLCTGRETHNLSQNPGRRQPQPPLHGVLTC